jgi:UDP-N-acetylmuramate dehydrogenase
MQKYPIEENAPLKAMNTFGIDAKARWLARPAGLEQLLALLDDWRTSDLEKKVLGGGSNILLTGDVEALLIHYGDTSLDVIKETDEHVWVRAGGGYNWHRLVLRCIETGLAGIENLSLIPGNAGAAPIQNIGAYGVELEEVFDSLDAVELATGELHTFGHADCEFGYRDSIFKKSLKGRYLITGITLKLNRKPDYRLDYGDIRKTLEEMGVKEPSIAAVSDAVCRIRRSKLPDPASLGNAGSFFKNPLIPAGQYEILRRKFPEIPGYRSPAVTGITVSAQGTGGTNASDTIKVPAGWLIEKAGWKGRRIGNTGPHNRQALVIVNHGGATGTEVLDVARRISDDVERMFGITLNPEVNIW